MKLYKIFLIKYYIISVDFLYHLPIVFILIKNLNEASYIKSKNLFSILFLTTDQYIIDI